MKTRTKDSNTQITKADLKEMAEHVAHNPVFEESNQRAATLVASIKELPPREKRSA